jgi:SnoaL-like domain
MQKFKRAVEAMDADAIAASLAEDVVFQSPIVFHAYEGRAAVAPLLRAVATVFQDFRYTGELHGGKQTALSFTARVGDKRLEGIDLGEVNAEGLVTKLTVFVRPLSAALALAEAMKAALAKAAGG